MKSFVFALFLVVAAVMANPVQERWNRVHQHCQQSPDLFVPETIFEQLRNGQSPALPANFGLHAKCMLVELGLQDHQGKVISQGVKEAAQRHYTDGHKIHHIVEKCSESKATPEKTALNLFKCLGDNRINIGQF